MTTPAPDQDQDQPAAQPVDPATGQISPAVLDALGDQLEQRRAERAAEAERQRATTGGPCSRCGASESWPRPGRGGWARDDRGAICARCDAERRDFGKPEDVERPRGRPEAPILPDSEHRAKVIARLVGPDEARTQWPPLLQARARELLAWFCETPGAEPGRGVEGFAYVDLAALKASLHAKPAEPAKRYSRGRRHRCPSCGAKGEVWTVQQVGVPRPTTSTGELAASQRAHFRVTWTCTNCRHTDVEQRAEQLPDVPAPLASG